MLQVIECDGLFFWLSLLLSSVWFVLDFAVVSRSCLSVKGNPNLRVFCTVFYSCSTLFFCECFVFIDSHVSCRVLCLFCCWFWRLVCVVFRVCFAFSFVCELHFNLITDSVTLCGVLVVLFFPPGFDLHVCIHLPHH